MDGRTDKAATICFLFGEHTKQAPFGLDGFPLAENLQFCGYENVRLNICGLDGFPLAENLQFCGYENVRLNICKGLLSKG